MRHLFLVCILFYILINVYPQIDSNINTDQVIDSIKPEILTPTLTIQDSLLLRRSRVTQQSIESILFQSFERERQIQKKMINNKIIQSKELIDTNFLKELSLPYLNNKVIIAPSPISSVSELINKYNYGYDIVLNPTIKIFPTRSNPNSYNQYIKNSEKFLRKSRSKKYGISDIWLIPVIIISIILFGVANLFYNKYFKQILNAAFNYRNSILLMQDNSIILGRLSFLLNFLHSINVSIFLVQLCNYFNIKPFDVNLFIYFITFLLVIPLIYFIKTLVNNIIGLIFNTSNIFKEYSHSYYLLNKSLGIYLSPVVIVIPYINQIFVPYLINVGICILGFYYMLRLIHGLKIIFQKDVSILYLILYLCILEILPVFWIYKFIISFILSD